MSGETLTVGVPREIKAGEKRVGLTPGGVRTLKESGVSVLVEKGAGEDSDYPDAEYEKAGAEMVSRPGELYQKSGLIKKVKEPLAPEWEFLKQDQIFFCYLHLASPENRKLVEILLEKRAVGIGLETAEKNGRTIFLEPMSEIAGTLAGYFAGLMRQTVRVEKEKIVYPPRFQDKMEWVASQFPEIPENLNPGCSVIFGGGTAGRKAAETILKMGGEVDLVEKREERREELRQEFKAFGVHFRCWGLEENFRERLGVADVWIGCVHVVGQRAPLVLSREELQKLSRGKPKVILDIAVDQGGNFPEARSTTYADSLYLDSFGNRRFGVTNVPSLCGQGASQAIEKVTLSCTLQLARDWKKALREHTELRTGLQVFGGKLVNEAVAAAHQLSWEPAKL